MSTVSRSLSPPATAAPRAAVDWQQRLGEFFSVSFSIWHGESGDELVGGDHPPLNDSLAIAELVRQVAWRGQVELIAEADGAAVLAIPVGDGCVGVGLFLTGDATATAGNDAATELFVSSPAAAQWAARQTRWQAAHLLRLGSTAVKHFESAALASRLEDEVESVSDNLASTYEEISLLYAVAQQLRISSTEDELAREALRRLQDCVPARSFIVQLLPPVPGDEDFSHKSRPRFISVGEQLVEHERFTELVNQLELGDRTRPFVANPPLTAGETWTFPEVRELILVPLCDDSHLFGWLAAINHEQGSEFGTVEANLISSVAAMLALHNSNRALYREQAEFVANVVRALVSAIDAKDPYTSGHSDRVARFAVRIALELRCEAKFVNTIYLAGLLHDVGKIGIEDSVLRKAGRLSDAEFEHIKLHPELGCKILAELKQLSDILPAVLHHHERWDGLGYPHGLAGEAIPEMARIMAVADAYDAMTSDRPYRKGLSDEQVDKIMHEGSGKQWDSRVLVAFFAAKADILAIADRNRPQLGPFEEQWT